MCSPASMALPPGPCPWRGSPARPPRRRGICRPAAARAPPGRASSGRRLPATGPTASFWAENPEVPKRPIRVWQIWNEENFKYFVARPNPAEYGKLVKISYAAIKGADPGAKIVLGGMFARPREGLSKRKPRKAYIARRDFLSQMYKSTPGIASKFTASRCTPTRAPSSTWVPEIEEVRAALKKNHDAAQGPLDHRAWLELPAPDLRQPLREGPGWPGGAAEGRLHAAARATRGSGACSRSTGSRSTTSPVAATSATAAACSAPASSPKPVLVRLREVRRRHSVAASA